MKDSLDKQINGPYMQGSKLKALAYMAEQAEGRKKPIVTRDKTIGAAMLVTVILVVISSTGAISPVWGLSSALALFCWLVISMLLETS